MLCNVREGIGEGMGNWFEGNIRRVVGDGVNTLFWFDHWVGDSPLRIKFPRLFDLAVNKECLVAKMEREGWEEGGRAWLWRRRSLAWEEDSVRECIVLFNNVVLQVTVSDTWRWTLDTIHGYFVREAYRFITTNGDQVDRSLVDNVWHRHIPSKVSLFVWRLLRNRLPTRDNLLRRNILHATTSMCVAGCDVLETASHLFLACGISLTLWFAVRSWLGVFSVLPNDIRDYHLHFCYMAGLPRCTHSFLQGIWYACVGFMEESEQLHFQE
jgi:hypothetical protein